MSAGHRNWPLLLVGLILAELSLPARPAAATDEAWMATPYRAVVWLALPRDQETRNMWADRLSVKLAQRCKSHFGAAVKCEIAMAPQAVADTVLAGDEAPALEAIGAPDDEIWKLDKVFFVAIRREQVR